MTSQDLMPTVTIATPARKHRWVGEHRIPACDSFDGNERTERGCPLCGLVKITVHYLHGIPQREWRTAKGRRIMHAATPPCEGEVAS